MYRNLVPLVYECQISCQASLDVITLEQFRDISPLVEGLIESSGDQHEVCEFSIALLTTNTIEFCQLTQNIHWRSGKDFVLVVVFWGYALRKNQYLQTCANKSNTG